MTKNRADDDIRTVLTTVSDCLFFKEIRYLDGLLLNAR